MPRTLGEGLIHVSNIDSIFNGEGRRLRSSTPPPLTSLCTTSPLGSPVVVVVSGCHTCACPRALSPPPSSHGAVDRPIPEVLPTVPDAVEERIARFISDNLVEDNATLQV